MPPKMKPQVTAFSFRPLHALVAARRPKAVASGSAHAPCSANGNATGAVAAGWNAADSVAVSCIAACCASLPAEHCRPAAAHHIAAALHSCFATMQPALCRLRRPSLTACSRFDSSASWVSCVGPRISAVPVASPSALLRLQLSAARVIAACALLLAQQRAPKDTYSSQHSLLARGSIPRQVESNTKVTALCTARIPSALFAYWPLGH